MKPKKQKAPTLLSRSDRFDYYAQLIIWVDCEGRRKDEFPAMTTVLIGDVLTTYIHDPVLAPAAKAKGVVFMEWKELYVWLLQIAKEKGFVNAQYRVAMCYASGDGAPIDSKECLRWMLKAAMQGLDEAQKELVRLYSGNFLSRGGDPLKEDPIEIKDLVEAFAWDILSCDYRGGLEFYKDDMEKLSADDIAKAYRRAKELKVTIAHNK